MLFFEEMYKNMEKEIFKINKNKEFIVVWKLQEMSASIFIDIMTLKKLKTLVKDMGLTKKCYAIIDGKIVKNFKNKRR